MPFDLKLLSTINCNQQEECLTTAHPLSDGQFTNTSSCKIEVKAKV